MQARRIGRLAAVAAAALFSLAVGLGAALAPTPADAQTGGYTVNGQPVDANTHRYLSAIGIPPGAYWLAPNGTWGVMGNPTPLGHVATLPDPAQVLGHRGYSSGPGSLGGTGDVYGNGATSYGGAYAPRGGVVSDGNGCHYVAGWSNC